MNMQKKKSKISPLKSSTPMTPYITMTNKTRREMNISGINAFTIVAITT